MLYFQDKIGCGGCRSVNEFEKMNRVGEGTYGIVYRARDTKTGEIVSYLISLLVVHLKF